MATVLIVGSKTDPGLERVTEELEQQGYSVIVRRSTDDLVSLIQKDHFDGVINFENGQVAECLIKYDAGVQIHKNGDGWKVYKSLQDVSKIEDIFTKALFWSLKRNRPISAVQDEWYQKGRTYSQQGDFISALKAYKESLKGDPKNSDALCELLNIVYQKPELMNELDDATFLGPIKNFIKGIFSTDAVSNIKPLEDLINNQNHPEPYVYLGEFKLNHDDTKGAYAAFREAVIRSNMLNIQEILNAQGTDEKTLQQIARSLQIVSPRIARLFSVEWKALGNIVLKVYDKNESDRARIEQAFIVYGKKYQNLLRLPNNAIIQIPHESKLVDDEHDTKIINRMNRLQGINAYHDLVRIPKKDRESMLTKLVAAAAAVDHFFSSVVYEKEPEFKKMIVNGREKFVQRRIQKFLEPFESVLGQSVTTEDRQIFEAAAQFADERLYDDTRPWLLSIRTDHRPQNYLIDYTGNRVTDTLENFVKSCTLNRVDFEHNQIMYGLWDIINLIEYPGSEAEKEDLLPLALRYIITRLYLKKQDSINESIDELYQQLQEARGPRKYAKFDAFVKKYDYEFGFMVDPLHPDQKKAVHPIAKARIQYLGLRFLRHLELAGSTMRNEQACAFLLQEIKKQSLQTAQTELLAQSYLGGDDLPKTETCYEKVHRYKQLLASHRKFHIKHAQESLEQLAVDKELRNFDQIQKLYILMKDKDYFGKALSVIGV